MTYLFLRKPPLEVNFHCLPLASTPPTPIFWLGDINGNIPPIFLRTFGYSRPILVAVRSLSLKPFSFGYKTPPIRFSTLPHPTPFDGSSPQPLTRVDATAAYIVCRVRPGYYVSGVRLSVRPYHPAAARRCCGFAAVRRTARIHRSIAARPAASSNGAAARRSAANAEDRPTTLSDDVGSWTATCLV